MNFLSELEQLWHETLGDPRICVAILDGPVDLDHPSLANARLKQPSTLVPTRSDRELASLHGTYVTSLIFGQHTGPVRGIAPGCRGVLLPIFVPRPGQETASCTQLELARAIKQALDAGAVVINVSGGQIAPNGEAHPQLAEVVRQCNRRGVLIVAAAGNDGCECFHVPAALESVLAVGAMDARGEPLDLNNWGGSYQFQGIVAPGRDLLGARSGGGTLRLTGTSGAAAIVSGLVALLLSLQLRLGKRPDPHEVRQALLRTAVDCRTQSAWDCHRLLVGRLNLSGSIKYLFRDLPPMSVSPEPLDSELKSSTPLTAGLADKPYSSGPVRSLGAIPSADVQPSACGCGAGCGAQANQKVYALGRIGYDLISEARQDYFVVEMSRPDSQEKHQPRQEKWKLGQRSDPLDQRKMLDHLDKNEEEAASIEWTLLLETTPIYAVRPQGPFAAKAYSELRKILRGQLPGGQSVERISMAGIISGQTQLMSGQTVPVLIPDLRGVYYWPTKDLTVKVGKTTPDPETGLTNFLDKVYYGHRNVGLLAQDRALNYAATNAFHLQLIFEKNNKNTIGDKEEMELDSIKVTPSPYCRPGSDCWDVEIYFFFPKQNRDYPRRVCRITVDVSDVVPVMVGPMREWHTRV